MATPQQQQENIVFHSPPPQEDKLPNKMVSLNDAQFMNQRNNIRAVHLPLRDGKEKQSFTTAVTVRDIYQQRAQNTPEGETFDVASGVVPTPGTLMLRKSYVFPVMTNGELRRLLDHYNIDYKKRMSGDQIVCTIGERLKFDLQNFADDSQCAVYMNNIIDMFPSSRPIRPNRTSASVHLITFFVEWIVMLQGIPDISVSATAGDLSYVPGVYNKALLCAASKPITTRKRKHYFTLQDTNVTIETEEEVDHIKMLEEMTKPYQVETHYTQHKGVLKPEYLLVLKEILDYTVPQMTLNKALSIAKKTISQSNYMAVCNSINNINTLINAFDMYDTPICPEFDHAVNKTASIRNIVFQIRNTMAAIGSREHKENMRRFVTFRLMGNLPYSSIEPTELSNIIITQNMKMDMIDYVIKGYALTPYLCLKYLENLCCLLRTFTKQTPHYGDNSIFSAAAQTVAEGKYQRSQPVHRIATMSVSKRYTAMSLLEAYVELDYKRKLKEFYYLKSDSYLWFVYHALFFQRIDLYRYTIERAYVAGRYIENVILAHRVISSNITNLQNIILVPILLLLDSYDQIYQCEGPNKICTFQICTNVMLHKYPRLYDPTSQCAMYHKSMTDMHVPLKPYDLYENVVRKYLRTVFFGRHANERSETDARYKLLFDEIRRLMHVIACTMLDITTGTITESHITLIKAYMARPALSPDNRFMRNSSTGQSTLSYVSGLKEPATSFDYMRGGGSSGSGKRRRCDAPIIITEHKPKLRRYNNKVSAPDVHIAPQEDPRRYSVVGDINVRGAPAAPATPSVPGAPA